jgi:uncharacterized protein (TIGR02246 family)
MDVDQRSLSAEAESEVLKVIAEFAATWNRHDMDAMHDLCTDDAEWINIVGMHWRGKAAVYKGHDALHKTTFADTEMTIEDVKARAIAPGVVCAVAGMTFGAHVDPTGREEVGMETMGTYLLLDTGDSWKIVHFHNTVIDQAARPFDPVNSDSAIG